MDNKLCFGSNKGFFFLFLPQVMQDFSAHKAHLRVVLSSLKSENKELVREELKGS